MEKKIKEFQERINYSFKNIELLITALTHSSWINEHKNVNHNERLEFLGDAVLEMMISEKLFHGFTEAREGTLTRLRSRMVNEASLAEIAFSLNIPPLIRMGRGEELQGGRRRPALLADTLEAIFGALFLDCGYAKASIIILSFFQKSWPKVDIVPQRKDYKTCLQEYTQGKYHKAPQYTLMDQKGPEHAKVFFIMLTLPEETKIFAQGTSLKKAEQEAAYQALLAYGELEK